MRRAALLSLCFAWAGCSLNTTGSGDDFTLGDDSSIDTGVLVEDSQVDSESVDTTPSEDSAIDSAMIDSTVDSAIDTGPFDTGPFDTGAPDTGPFDTGPFDTGTIDTGPEAPPPTGILMGSGAAGSTATLNLTTEGTIGWAHWALAMSSDFNRKSGADVITKGTVFGGTATRYGSYPQKFTWSDGVPTASASTSAGLYVMGKDDGFRFDVDGDPTTARTLKIYLAWNNAAANVEASLSDSSAPAFTGPVPPSPSTSTAIEPVVYTITFKPLAAGAKLNVKITKTSTGLNQYISLLAATLH